MSSPLVFKQAQGSLIGKVGCSGEVTEFIYRAEQSVLNFNFSNTSFMIFLILALMCYYLVTVLIEEIYLKGKLMQIYTYNIKDL